MSAGQAASTSAALSDRDRRIVLLVARFGQVSSAHVHALLFPDVSRTPVDRALLRLTNAGYLIRIERRLVGGNRGGSGQYVYALGRQGFNAFYDGKYYPHRAIRPHTLAIMDCVVIFKQLERAGVLSIPVMHAEPDCWATIAGYELKPDLYVELEKPGRAALPVWLEVDLGSEGISQIRGKLERYVKAARNADGTALERWPVVVWAAVDDERARELHQVVSRLPEGERQLFRVWTIARLAELFAG